MIQVINFPPANRYLLDGNNTKITATSDNPDGYFRAKIFIDDVLFDEQGWSRKDDFTATKDLIYLYNAYFKPYFLGVYESGLLEQTNFKKKVSIIIEEYNINTDVFIESITLPDFYLLYNVKSQLFDDSQKVHLFGLKAEQFKMKKDGTIVIPFYANAVAEDVNVTIYDDLNNVLNTQSSLAVTGKKVFIFTLKLSEVTVISSILYLRAVVTVGTESVTKYYAIMQLPNYEVKELIFQNNFGYYIPAYFDGDFEDITGLKVQSYERYDTSTAVYAIEEDQTYTINTGSLSIREKEIVKEVATSIDCFFNDNSQYIPVNTGTKKAPNLKSLLNIYAEDLVFTRKAGLPFSNLNLQTVPEAPVLEILSVTRVEGSVYSVEFQSNFSLYEVLSAVRLNSGMTWSSAIAFSTPISPQTRIVSFGGGSFQMQIHAFYNAELVYSNIFTYTP